MNNSIDFVSIDFETATSKRYSICEIGICVVKKGEKEFSKSWLVQPPGNEYDSINISIHGITPEMTESSPLFCEVWEEVKSYLENNIVIAHNTAFDMYALRDVLDYYHLEYPSFSYYCSYRLAKYILDSSYGYSLSSLCFQYNIDQEISHRAKEDAESCAKIILKCIEKSPIVFFDEWEKKYSFSHGYFSKDEFRPQRANSVYGSKQNYSSIVGDSSKFNQDSIFFEKRVCITGTLSYYTRMEALKIIADIGGVPVNSVTRELDILIIGEQDPIRVGKDKISSKHKKVLDLISKGFKIDIMSEKEFFRNI